MEKICAKTISLNLSENQQLKMMKQTFFILGVLLCSVSSASRYGASWGGRWCPEVAEYDDEGRSVTRIRKPDGTVMDVEWRTPPSGGGREKVYVPNPRQTETERLRRAGTQRLEELRRRDEIRRLEENLTPKRSILERFRRKK